MLWSRLSLCTHTTKQKVLQLCHRQCRTSQYPAVCASKFSVISSQGSGVPALPGIAIPRVHVQLCLFFFHDMKQECLAMQSVLGLFFFFPYPYFSLLFFFFPRSNDGKFFSHLEQGQLELSSRRTVGLLFQARILESSVEMSRTKIFLHPNDFIRTLDWIDLHANLAIRTSVFNYVI